MLVSTPLKLFLLYIILFHIPCPKGIKSSVRGISGSELSCVSLCKSHFCVTSLVQLTGVASPHTSPLWAAL